VGDTVSGVANLLHYDPAAQTRLIRTIDGFARSHSEYLPVQLGFRKNRANPV